MVFNRTSGNRHKVQEIPFKGKTHSFFTVGATEHGPTTRGVVESPSLEISKPQMNTALRACFRWPCLEQRGWSRWPPEVPSNLNHSVILRSAELLSWSQSVSAPQPTSCRYFRVSCHSTLSLLSIFSSLFCILPAEKLQFVILPSASYFFLKVNTMSCL